MITAHLPAGYVLSRAAGWRGPALVAALVGAVWPDLDLIWFYLIDDRAVHHHRYWVHAPGFALAVSALLVLAGRTVDATPVALGFSAGWLLHILLDAPVGGIMWLWPMSEQLYYLVEVPATQAHWLLSFIIHWSFLAELTVWAVAATLLLRRVSR